MTNPDECRKALLPCPFCGEQPYLSTRDYGYYAIICKGCGVAFYGFTVSNFAKDAWNTRQENSRANAEMERVKACEHIAEGDMDGNDWRILRNLCPSTAAVAALRDKYETLLKRESGDDDTNVVSKWQPIETDPKNRTVVLINCGRGWIYTAYYDHSAKQPRWFHSDSHGNAKAVQAGIYGWMSLSEIEDQPTTKEKL